MCDLISDDLLEKIPDLFETKRNSNPICYIKLYMPDSVWTWYIIEFSKNNNSTCYGYIEGMETSLGFFSLDEIKNITGPLGFKVQRDKSFMPSALLSLNKLNLMKKLGV